MSAQTVLVLRATGTQGVAVCRNLYNKGIKIHALVKDANDARAKALSAYDAGLFEGDIDDRSALDRAIAGCTGVWINLMPKFDEQASEPRQGKLVLEAAKAAGVKQVVTSTASNVGSIREGSIPKEVMYSVFLGWKGDLEDEVKKSGLETWTILRPAYVKTQAILDFD